MIKTRFNEVWKKLTGFDKNFNDEEPLTLLLDCEKPCYMSVEDAYVINQRLDCAEKELDSILVEFRAHEAIEHPIIGLESLKHDIGILNSIVKGINTRLDQIDNRTNSNKPENPEML